MRSQSIRATAQLQVLAYDQWKPDRRPGGNRGKLFARTFQHRAVLAERTPIIVGIGRESSH